METIFISTENSKINEPHKFRLTLADKRNLKDVLKNMALENVSIYYTWKNIKPKQSNNKLKILTWNDEFHLLHESYLIFNIQDYFEYTIEKHKTFTENPPVEIYVNRIKNRIVFQVKTGYKLELLSPETMKLLGSTNNQNKVSENVPSLKVS